MNLNLTDSHAHISDPAFKDDRDSVIKACFAAGVKTIFEVGCNIDEWGPALDLCGKYARGIYAILGLHPAYAANFSNEKFATLAASLRAPAARAVGEIGLDYYYKPFSKEQQIMVFERCLALAAEIKKPSVLHIRAGRAPGDFTAYEDAFSILKKHSVSGGVLHCFSGRYEDAARALDLGFKLGFNGIITYKKNNDLRETLRRAGLKNIVLETDCPYLPPQSKRGQRNSPLNIPEIAQYIADFLNVPLEEVAEVTTKNCKEIFGNF